MYITYHTSLERLTPFIDLLKRDEISLGGNIEKACYVSLTMFEAKEWAKHISKWRGAINKSMSIYSVIIDRIPLGTMINQFNPTHLIRTRGEYFPIRITSKAVVLRKELEIKLPTI